MMMVSGRAVVDAVTATDGGRMDTEALLPKPAKLRAAGDLAARQLQHPTSRKPSNKAQARATPPVGAEHQWRRRAVQH